MPSRTRLALAVLLALAVALLVGAVVERQARARFAAAVLADARLRQALLASEIARFRLLPLALADDRDVIATLAGAPGDALDIKLAALARDTGAAQIYLIGPAGRTLAASNAGTRASFVGQDYRFRRYYRAARERGTGEQFALGSVSRRPGLYLARRTRDGGVVVVKLDFAAVERQWRAAGGTTFVTDRAGIVLVTSRPDWRFAATVPIAPLARAAAMADIGVKALRPAPITRGAGLLVATPLADESGWQVNLARPTRTAIGAVVRSGQIAAALATLALLALA